MRNNIMSFITLIDNYWKKYVYTHSIISHNIPLGAATFSLLTINAINNKENISFCCLCHRPYDYIKAKTYIRRDKYLQYQIIMHNIDDARNIVTNFLQYIINVYSHSIIFIEDHWCSPTMGSYGYGWEVRINNLEIAQITYFTKFLSRNIIHNNVVEIVFGIERLYMLLHNKKCISDIDYHTYNFNNEIYTLYINKSIKDLHNELIVLCEKQQHYDDFLLSNLIFNILDSKCYYTENMKNIIMYVICNKLNKDALLNIL